MSVKKRIFAGVKVEFSERTMEFFRSAEENLNESEIKWTEPVNMHITLKFLGDVHIEIIPQISSKLKTVSGSFNEFEALLKGVGIFKDVFHPRILWFGLRNCPSFDKLKNEIENSMKSLDFEVDYRSFSPHLTVGRFKDLVNIEQLKKFISMNREVYLQTVPVKELILFESILKPEGPKYSIIDKFSLGIDEGFREIRF